MRFAGKSALVTGAARGIGKAIAQRLASEGASVIIGDIDEATAIRAAGDIAAGGGKAVACMLDVTKPDAAAAADRKSTRLNSSH